MTLVFLKSSGQLFFRMCIDLDLFPFRLLRVCTVTLFFNFVGKKIPIYKELHFSLLILLPLGFIYYSKPKNFSLIGILFLQCFPYIYVVSCSHIIKNAVQYFIIFMPDLTIHLWDIRHFITRYVGCFPFSMIKTSLVTNIMGTHSLFPRFIFLFCF